MTAFDPSLLKQVKEMSSDPLASLFVELFKDKLEKEKKMKEEENKKFKIPKFTFLQMVALSPLVALISARILIWLWNGTVDALRTLH